MLQDNIRTQTYYKAILSNSLDFKDKIVLDIGTGSGILAIFAIFAGAKHVYAIEASNSYLYAKQLVESNNLTSQISVINSKLEDIDFNSTIKEKVDTIISEPLGILLVNERMLETFILGRDLFLKPNGKLFPSSSIMHFIPFTDEVLYNEHKEKVRFWQNSNFFNVNLTSLYETALDEKFNQPIIEAYNPNCHVSNETCIKIFDFYSLTLKDLTEFTVDLIFTISKPCVVNGISGWFDTVFSGSTTEVVLSTSPRAPPTHWYQIKFLLKHPIAVNRNQIIKGIIKFTANKFQSYDVYLNLEVDGYNIKTEGKYDLKTPDFRNNMSFNI